VAAYETTGKIKMVFGSSRTEVGEVDEEYRREENENPESAYDAVCPRVGCVTAEEFEGRVHSDYEGAWTEEHRDSSGAHEDE